MDYAKLLGASLPKGTILLVLFLPDVDRLGNRIDQDQWVSAALAVFGRLFRGATAFPKGRGVWRDDERGGELVFEQPTIIHCYTAKRFLTDEAMHELAAFLRKLGRETHQGEVGIVIDGEYFGISKFDD